jgi:hypothetical protein
MEGMSALVVAGNLGQFLIFSRALPDIISRSWMPSAFNNPDFERLADDLARRLDSMAEDLPKYYAYLRRDLINDTDASRRAMELQIIVNECQALATDCMDRINKHWSIQRPGDWKSVMATIRYMWTQDDLNNLEVELGHLQNKLDFHVLESLR